MWKLLDIRRKNKSFELWGFHHYLHRFGLRVLLSTEPSLQDVSACVGDGETRRVWSPGAQVLATSDIECIDRTFAEPEVVVLRKGHLGRVVGLDVDCNLLVQWDELDSPKSARYDQLQSKDPGADVWGSWSVCGFWANVHGHLWICPDPSNPEQCFYEEAPQDGGFLHGTLKMDQQGHGGVEPAWWLAEVWAEPGEYETPEDAETSETLSHDLENHFSIGMIRLRLSRANRLEVQISADGGDWSEMRELDRQLPKIDWPLQILRSDGQTDCSLAIFQNLSGGSSMDYVVPKADVLKRRSLGLLMWKESFCCFANICICP